MTRAAPVSFRGVLVTTGFTISAGAAFWFFFASRSANEIVAFVASLRVSKGARTGGGQKSGIFVSNQGTV